jgi:hypothetical protein
MKTDYISLTTAIELFEENKRSYINTTKQSEADVNICVKNRKMRWYANEDEYNRLSPIHRIEDNKIECNNICDSHLNQLTDFIFHIINSKIPLYSIDQDFSYRKIPDQVLGNIEYFSLDTVSLLSTCAFKYKVCSNYTYEQAYNPSTNYDVLKNITTDEIEYINLSIKSDEFKEFMRKIKEE